MHAQISSVLTVVLLVSCADGTGGTGIDCSKYDPHKRGLFRTVVGLTSGCYEQRLEAKKRKLEQEEQQRHEQLHVINERERERAVLESDIRSLQDKLVALDGELRLLNQQAAELRMSQSAAFYDAQLELDAMNAEIEQLLLKEGQGISVQELQDRRDDLEEQYGLLVKVLRGLQQRR